MSKFDLSKVQDFQRLTLQSAASALGTLSSLGRDPSKWDILEASYNGVLFHVFQSKSEYQAGLGQIQDTGGRRKIKYRYPYRDGQTTDDLGREAETFEIEAIIHGQLYLSGLKTLLTELNKPTPGTLVHPVRGNIKCVPESWNITHKSDSRKSAIIHIVFTEHNFTIGNIRDVKDTSVKNALSRALDFLNKIDNAITNIVGAGLFVQSLVNQVRQSLNDYKVSYGNSLSNINATFNTRGASEFPGLLPTNLGGARNPDGTITTTDFQTVVSPQDKYAGLDLSETTVRALAVADISKQIAETRSQTADLIQTISSGANGQGALEFYADILDLKNGAIALQDALEKGIASSRAQIIDYTVPRDMSLREVAFLNGLSVNLSSELEILNPQIDSVNMVAKDTVLKVPVV